VLPAWAAARNTGRVFTGLIDKESPDARSSHASDIGRTAPLAGRSTERSSISPLPLVGILQIVEFVAITILVVFI
jgi:hypothetical protein